MTTQMSLSFELICFINWVLKNEKAMLNALVKQAIEKGFGEELEKINLTDQTEIPEQFYVALIDFLSFLEKTLIKHLENIPFDNKTKDAILPTLQKIETDNLDFKTVWLSMKQTKALVNKKPSSTSQLIDGHHEHSPTSIPQGQDPAKILFEQLLKNWKPNSKETVN